MPTIIDELIVRLDLDPRDFEAGKKKAADAFLKTKQEAISSGKGIEDSSKKASDSIDRITKSALALFAVLLGGKGLKDFVAGVVVADSAIGRMATNAGMSARDFQAWQLAIERVGGSAEGAAASLQAAQQQLYNLRVNGKGLPSEINRLGAMGGPINFNGSTEDYALSVANAAHNAAQKYGAATVASLLQGAGYDTGFTNLAIAKGGAGLKGYLGSMPVVSDPSIQRTQELQNQWSTLQQTIGQFFNTMVADFEPVVRPFLTDFQTWANAMVKLEPTIKGITDEAGKVADSLGGLRIVIDGIIALWAADKALRIFGAAKGLVGLGAGAAAGAGGGGALGWLAGAVSGAASTAAGAAATVGAGAIAAWLATTTPVGAGEGDIVRRLNAGSGSRSWRNNNPGNIEAGPYATSMGATGSDGRFAVFPSYEVGRRAQERLLFESRGYRNLTLAQAIAKWSPSADGNNTGAYVAAMGGDPNAIMSSFSPTQRAKLLDAMQAHEGWRPGAKPWWSGRAMGGMSPNAQWASLAHHNVSNSSSVHVGELHVHTAATDGAGIASSIRPALKRSALTWAANTGPA